MQLFLPLILIVKNINLINLVATSLLHAKYLSDFRKSLNLIDAWRKLHPRSREYSRFTLASRLDKFFISCKMLSSIRSCEITAPFSDQDYVTLCLEFDQAQVRGPGL